MARIIDAFTQFFDDEGNPLVDGLLKFYESGTNNTDKDTFADINETIKNTNPVVLDAAGQCPNIFGTGAYNVISYTSASVQRQQFDPVGANLVVSTLSAWNAQTIYGFGELVTGDDGKNYRSIVAANQDNNPTTSPSKWEEVAFNRIWNSFVTYGENDPVLASDGNTYISRAAANLGNDPTAASTFWNRITGNLTAETLAYTFATDADKALTTAENRYGRIVISGSVLTAARSLAISDNERAIYVQNDEAFDVTVKTAAGTGIAVLAGTSRPVICDGANVLDPMEAFTTLIGIRDVYRNLFVTNNVTNPLFQMDITTDEILLENAAGSPLRAATVSETVDITVSGLGGLDTGSEALSTWYHMWVISDGATTGSLLSLSSTTPTMPGAYTYKAYIGAVYNDSSADLIGIEQHDKEVFNTLYRTILDGTITAFAWTSISVAAFFPTTAKKIRIIGGAAGGVSFSRESTGQMGDMIYFSDTVVGRDLGVFPTLRNNWSQSEIPYGSAVYYYTQPTVTVATFSAASWTY